MVGEFALAPYTHAGTAFAPASGTGGRGGTGSGGAYGIGGGAYGRTGGAALEGCSSRTAARAAGIGIAGTPIAGGLCVAALRVPRSASPNACTPGHRSAGFFASAFSIASTSMRGADGARTASGGSAALTCFSISAGVLVAVNGGAPASI